MDISLWGPFSPLHPSNPASHALLLWVTLATFMCLQSARHSPTPEPLHMLCPLSGHLLPHIRICKFASFFLRTTKFVIVRLCHILSIDRHFCDCFPFFAVPNCCDEQSCIFEGMCECFFRIDFCSWNWRGKCILNIFKIFDKWCPIFYLQRIYSGLVFWPGCLLTHSMRELRAKAMGGEAKFDQNW